MKKIVSQIVDAMIYLDELGIAHRDIKVKIKWSKPENILLKDGLIPILIDFNIATRDCDPWTQSIADVECGSEGFMGKKQLM